MKKYRTALRKNEERRAGHSHTFYWLVLGNVQTPKPSSYALKARSGGGADSFEVASKPQAGPLVSAAVLGRTSSPAALVAGRNSAARLVITLIAARTRV